jgi:gluconolactonase
MISFFDPRLTPVVAGAVLERLCTGAIWSEGPVWLPGENAVLWSDIPNNRILHWSEATGLSVWREDVEYTNGHTLDAQGNLLHCSHGLRAIVRTPCVNGRIVASTPDELVVDRYLGRRLNSPNDVVVKRDGTVWFTDPPYGILSDREGHKAPSEQAGNHVFCFDPVSGVLRAVTGGVADVGTGGTTTCVVEPNGLAFSPDERLLYVSDTSAALAAPGQGYHHIVAFGVGPGNVLHDARVFATITPGLPDGFRVDVQGWVYTSSQDSVQVLHPDGTLLGKIGLPEKVGNLCFGGPDGRDLYIAASTSLYRVRLQTRGAQGPRPSQ